MQMNLPLKLQTLDDGRFLSVKALLDSGSTGSCISKRFVEKNEIPTKQMPRPIPIYNADGTLNKDGTIKEYVKIRMIIQDHVERIQFAVSNIGESDVFIGHEWLKKHNPEVDWRKSALFFTRCPDECGHITTLDELDGDPVEKQT
jgi:hypothetical protein